MIGNLPTAPLSPGAENLIAYNDENGVLIESGARNAIFGNAIHCNDLLGIDLLTGANANQAAPVLTTVQQQGNGLQISGILTSKPNTTFTLEFFANDSNERDGQYSLGKKTVKTNAAGVATFTFLTGLPPWGMDYFTASATDSSNNTSEFSSAINVI